MVVIAPGVAVDDAAPVRRVFEEYGVFAFLHRRSDRLVRLFDRSNGAHVFWERAIVGCLLLCAVISLLRDCCCRGVVEILSVFANLAGCFCQRSAEHIDAHITLTGASSSERAVCDGLDIAGDYIGVSTILDAGESGVAGDGDEGIRVSSGVGVAALEGEAA